MNLKERSVVFLTFLVTCLSLAFLAGGMGTQYWVVSTAVRPANNKSEGFVHFGLFGGKRELNHGFGERVYQTDVVDLMFRERTFMLKGLYISTIACVSVSLFFGVLAALLALVNTASNPTELVCHLPGLIGLNVLAGIGAFAAIVTWIVQFFVKLRYNVLTREDMTKFGWESTGRANIGHSFWLVCVALGLFALNAAILMLLDNKRKSRLRAQTNHMSGGGGGGLIPGAPIYGGGVYGGAPITTFGGSTLGGGSIMGGKKSPDNKLSSGNLMLY